MRKRKYETDEQFNARRRRKLLETETPQEKAKLLVAEDNRYKDNLESLYTRQQQFEQIKPARSNKPKQHTKPDWQYKRDEHKKKQAKREKAKLKPKKFNKHSARARYIESLLEQPLTNEDTNDSIVDIFVKDKKRF